MYSIYNEQRYRRKKQMFRIVVGIQTMLFHPILNIIWLAFAIGVRFFVMGVKWIVTYMEVYPLLAPAFKWCMGVIAFLFPILCAVAILQILGFLVAVQDEADLSIVFEERKEIKCQPPILIYKRRNRKSGVTKRIFSTVIPLECWQRKQEEICDRLNCHLVGKEGITYGGRNNDNGNRIVIETAKGRKIKGRGVLYDDDF